MHVQSSLFTRAATAASAPPPAAGTQQVTNPQTLDEHAFLQLLSTQLANQDPTSPEDETQMLAQLAQFSTVEGINNMSSAQSQMQASALLGKTVDALATSGNSTTPVSGQVTAVSWSGSNILLTLSGNQQVNLNQVLQVTN